MRTVIRIRFIRARLAPALLAALAFGALADVAAAAGRPDLVVDAVATAPASVQQGNATLAMDTLKNVGRARASASTVGYYLSSDARADAGDLALGSRLAGALRAKRSASDSTYLWIPGWIAPGSYYVVACADSRKQVRERRERNNCRASDVIVVFAPVRPELGDGEDLVCVEGDDFCPPVVADESTPVSTLPWDGPYQCRAIDELDGGCPHEERRGGFAGLPDAEAPAREDHQDPAVD